MYENIGQIFEKLPNQCMLMISTKNTLWNRSSNRSSEQRGVGASCVVYSRSGSGSGSGSGSEQVM